METVPEQVKKPLIVSITAFNDNTTFIYANGDEVIIPHGADYDFCGFIPDPMQIGMFRHILQLHQEITAMKEILRKNGLS